MGHGMFGQRSEGTRRDADAMGSYKAPFSRWEGTARRCCMGIAWHPICQAGTAKGTQTCSRTNQGKVAVMLHIKHRPQVAVLAWHGRPGHGLTDLI